MKTKSQSKYLKYSNRLSLYEEYRQHAQKMLKDKKDEAIADKAATLDFLAKKAEFDTLSLSYVYETTTAKKFASVTSDINYKKNQQQQKLSTIKNPNKQQRYAKKMQHAQQKRMDRLTAKRVKRDKKYLVLFKKFVPAEQKAAQANLDFVISQNQKNLADFSIKQEEIYQKKLFTLNNRLNSKILALQKKKEYYAAKAQNDIAKPNTDTYSLPDDIVLSVKNLSMHFGGLKAVDDLSFDVKQGEIFGLIGPNGAGKTTVFNCITRFYKGEGSLLFRAKDDKIVNLNDYKVHQVITCGIVRTFQNVEVVREVSVLDNLLIAAHRQFNSTLIEQSLHLPILKIEEKIVAARAKKVLEFLNLSQYADSIVWGLPYGILKKIEIARTLMSDPQMIILDEPAAGLNETETQELSQLIKQINKEYHSTILLVEHDMKLVMDICDTVCAINFGKLLALGTPKQVQQNAAVKTAYLGADSNHVD